MPDALAARPVPQRNDTHRWFRAPELSMAAGPAGKPAHEDEDPSKRENRCSPHLLRELDGRDLAHALALGSDDRLRRTASQDLDRGLPKRAPEIDTCTHQDNS